MIEDLKQERKSAYVVAFVGNGLGKSSLANCAEFKHFDVVYVDESTQELPSKPTILMSQSSLRIHRNLRPHINRWFCFRDGYVPECPSFRCITSTLANYRFVMYDSMREATSFQHQITYDQQGNNVYFHQVESE